MFTPLNRELRVNREPHSFTASRIDARDWVVGVGSRCSLPLLLHPRPGSHLSITSDTFINRLTNVLRSLCTLFQVNKRALSREKCISILSAPKSEGVLYFWKNITSNVVWFGSTFNTLFETRWTNRN